MRTWAEPSVDVNGIAGGSPHLQKTVLPVQAEANVSIRLAPGQDRDADRAECSSGCCARPRPAGAEVEIELLSAAPPGLVAARLAGRQARRRRLRARRSARGRCSSARAARSRSCPRSSARGHPGDRDRLRAQGVEHPLAERAPARRLPAARRRHAPRRCSAALASSASAAATRRRSRPSSPATRSSASCATCGSTRRLRTLARRIRARPSSSTSRGCSSTSCARLGLEDVELTEHGYVFATLPGTARGRADDRPDRARRHDARRDRHGRDADRPPRLRRRADRAARATRRRCSTRTSCPSSPSASGTTSSPATARRCSAPTTRRAWPRSWPRSRTSPGNPEPPRATVRVAFTVDEEIGHGTTHFDLERFGARRRLHARRLGPRRARDRDVLGRPGRDHDSRPQRPSRARRRESSSTRSSSPPTSSPRCRATGSRLRRPRGARATCTRPDRGQRRRGCGSRSSSGTTTTRCSPSTSTFLRRLADEVVEREPRARVTVDVSETYRNMRPAIEAHPRVIAAAEEAIRRVGRRARAGR